MIHHVPLRPPLHDFPADEWNIIEKGFHPEFLAQLETMMAVGNGYLGMRGCPEEGGPNVENATLVNGFYETRPILYAEEAYGFAKTGQTIVNVHGTAHLGNDAVEPRRRRCGISVSSRGRLRRMERGESR